MITKHPCLITWKRGQNSNTNVLGKHGNSSTARAFTKLHALVKKPAIRRKFQIVGHPSCVPKGAIFSNCYRRFTSLYAIPSRYYSLQMEKEYEKINANSPCQPFFFPITHCLSKPHLVEQSFLESPQCESHSFYEDLG